MFIFEFFKSFFNLKNNVSSLKRQYFIFMIVGVVSFIIGITLLKLFYEYFELDLILANSISFISVSAIHFILSIKFVFLRGKKSLTKEISLFYLVALLTLLLDNVLLYVLVESFSIYYIFAKILTVSAVSFASFVLRKNIVFKK